VSAGAEHEGQGVSDAPSGPARRSRLRALLLGAIGLLYLVSVPWYREADTLPPLLLGLPNWAAVAVACYLGAACLNAIAWWIARVSDSLPVDTADEALAGRRDDRPVEDEA